MNLFIFYQTTDDLTQPLQIALEKAGQFVKVPAAAEEFIKLVMEDIEALESVCGLRNKKLHQPKNSDSDKEVRVKLPAKH